MIRKGTMMVVLAFSAQLKSEPFKMNLIIPSAGTWMSYSESSRSHFNKMSVTAYTHIYSVKTVVSVPLAWTRHVKTNENVEVDAAGKRHVIKKTTIKDRVFPSDCNIYIGKRFGWIEPRAGLKFPMGYAADNDWKSKAWIGDNNVRLQTGFSISRTSFEQIGLPFGMEAMISVAVTDTMNNARYRRGTIGGQLYIKSSINITKKVNFGGELAVYGKSGEPSWNRNKAPGERREHGLTLLPTVFGSYRLGKKLYVGLKGGFGPSLAWDYEKKNLQHSRNTSDIGMSLQIYP